MPERRPTLQPLTPMRRSAIGDGVAPNDLYPAERWLNAWRALRLAGRDDEARDGTAHAASRG